ncbi:helix-turn-helix domain-containing protein [Streptomyces xanthii]|uniref:Pyridoxamine 5'-phosphate oxidase family protein n=1 Tax=Streptomyces xanthii TaxID=2768069 RepID=A0A7H1B0P1_9ACTN|nr:pyridoxamine 5'-phosphate oxidase family protein [Streptomyces xanthii]QNS02296.1 pyridoxamine 5'-phosphate oxidase family protein [Streptomyces xanthii]
MTRTQHTGPQAAAEGTKTSTRESPATGVGGQSDLGRRLVARREALGLSREDLARLCGVDGNYIGYLEEHAASPSIGTLVRIADALGVTVDDLTGASSGHVQGRSSERRDASLETLDTAECLRLLGTHGIGRIAVFTVEGPAVFPVNYLVTGDTIAFRTAAEAVIASATETEVAFEIDRIDDVTAEGWSVLAVGELEATTDEEQRNLSALARSRPWAGGPRTLWMKLDPVRLTGRRVVHR